MAQSSSAPAQALFDEGKALMAAGKAAEACPKFEESQRLDPSSGTLINLALCYEKTGRFASAWIAYRDAAAAAKVSGNTDRERGARERAAAVQPKVSKLVIQVPPESKLPGLEITRDGIAVGEALWGLGVPADTGSHEVSARAPGHEDWQTKIDVIGNATTATVKVPRLAPAPEAAPEPSEKPAEAAPSPRASEPPTEAAEESSGLGGQRIGALVLGGVGVGGIVVGSIFGLQTISKKSKADETCTGTSCTTNEGVKAGNDAHAAGNVSTIAMIAGGALVAGGVVLWLTAPARGTPTTEVGLLANGVVLRRSF